MKSQVKIISGFVLPIIFLFLAGITNAQDCEVFFPFKDGSVRLMKSYDKKDKLTGSNRQKVISVKDIENGKEISVENQSYDKKDKLIAQDSLTMTCQGGVFKVDMHNYVPAETMKGLEGMEVKVDARDLEFPSNLTAGEQLKDGYIKIVASNMGIPMITLLVKIYDRKVEGTDDMTTPAGTFKCYKISQTVEVKSIGKYTITSKDWISKDVGTVRSESYDKNGNLMSYSILEEFK